MFELVGSFDLWDIKYKLINNTHKIIGEFGKEKI